MLCVLIVEGMSVVVNVMSLMSVMSPPPALCKLSVRTAVKLCILDVSALMPFSNLSKVIVLIHFLITRDVIHTLLNYTLFTVIYLCTSIRINIKGNSLFLIIYYIMHFFIFSQRVRHTSIIRLYKRSEPISHQNAKQIYAVVLYWIDDTLITTYIFIKDAYPTLLSVHV